MDKFSVDGIPERSQVVDPIDTEWALLVGQIMMWWGRVEYSLSHAVDFMRKMPGAEAVEDKVFPDRTAQTRIRWEALRIATAPTKAAETAEIVTHIRAAGEIRKIVAHGFWPIHVALDGESITLSALGPDDVSRADPARKRSDLTKREMRATIAHLRRIHAALSIDLIRLGFANP